MECLHRKKFPPELGPYQSTPTLRCPPLLFMAKTCRSPVQTLTRRDVRSDSPRLHKRPQVSPVCVQHSTRSWASLSLSAPDFLPPGLPSPLLLLCPLLPQRLCHCLCPRWYVVMCLHPITPPAHACTCPCTFFALLRPGHVFPRCHHLITPFVLVGPCFHKTSGLSASDVPSSNSSHLPLTPKRRVGTLLLVL